MNKDPQPIFGTRHSRARRPIRSLELISIALWVTCAVFVGCAVGPKYQAPNPPDGLNRLSHDPIHDLFARRDGFYPAR